MLDFQETLAGELRAAAPAAAAIAPPRSLLRRTPRSWFRAVGALGVPAIVAAAAGAFFLAPDRVVVAAAKAPVFEAPRIDPAPFRGTFTLSEILGPDVVPTEAYEVPIAAGSAYLYGGDRGWCLTAGKPALQTSGGSHITSCVLPEDFERFGIAVADGRYVAALPADVPPPVLRTPDGQERTLVPSPDLAIVDIEAPKGSSVVRFAKDGSTHVDPIR